jgi:V-type H+-transporting ATPase proteolipid subunit
MRIDSPSLITGPTDIVGVIPQGILGIAAGLAIGLAAIGAGYGIARAGASLCRSLTTAPEAFSKGLVSVVLAEALGIYGLLLSFMLIMRLEGVTDMSQGFMGLGSGLAIGLSCIGAGFGIALAGESLSRSVAEAPESFSKGLVSVVLAEALGIYGLLIGFMVVMRIDGATTLPDPYGAGWLAVASGLSIALAAIGGGVGIGYGGAALCSSLRTAPESFSKGLVSVVLAEALGIYGLLASFMLVMRLDVVVVATAMIGLSAALTIGIGALVAGVAIGWAGASMIGAMVGKPEVFSKSMVPVVLAEALAIYTLLVAFMLIMRV